MGGDMFEGKGVFLCFKNINSIRKIQKTLLICVSREDAKKPFSVVVVYYGNDECHRNHKRIFRCPYRI